MSGSAKRGTVYRLDFPSGKSYVGITAGALATRITEHRYGANSTSRQAVHNAWRLHGAPRITILAYVEIRMLIETERRAIASFGTLAPHGYNVSRGGETSPMHSPSVVAKVALSNRGQTRTAEQRARMALAHVGKKHSPESRARISATLSKMHREGSIRSNVGKKHSPERILNAVAGRMRARHVKPA